MKWQDKFLRKFQTFWIFEICLFTFFLHIGTIKMTITQPLQPEDGAPLFSAGHISEEQIFVAFSDCLNFKI